MAGPQSRVAAGGFWSQPQAHYSRETQNLLKEMMKESKLTNFQQRHLEKSLRGGNSLPVNCPPTHSFKERVPVSAPVTRKVFNARNYKPSIRTKEQMEDMGAFEKPDYTPSPNTRGKSRDKEAQRLANIMAFGKDIAPMTKRPVPQPRAEDIRAEKDRFDEIQEEIDERRSFLRDMEGLGQGAKYRPIIETEISQLIREMEVIDKKRTAELDRLIAESNASSQT